MSIQILSFIKKGTFLFLVVFISTSTYGQFYHGIEVGTNLNNANFIIDTSQEPSSAIGFSLGYAAERDLSEQMYVKVAVLVTKRNLKATNIRGFNTTSENWGLSVIEIPINLGYYLNYNNRNFQFFVDGGLNIDYNMRVYSENDIERITLNIGSEGIVKRIGTGVNIGGGLLFSKRLKVRLHYYYGLTSIANLEGDEWKNNGFGISLNYFLKKREPY